MEKIVLIGDSIAKGIIYSSELGRYTHKCESFIHLFCREEGFELSDHALYGCNIRKAIQLASRHRGDAAGSRAVLLMLGSSDCGYDWETVCKAPSGEHMCCTPPSQFYEEYGRLIKFVRELGAKPIMFNMTPVSGTKYLDWLGRKYSREKILEFLGCPERLEQCNEMYSLLLQRIAENCGVPIVDIRSALLPGKDISGLLCPDGIHPGAEAHRLIYSAVKGSLKELL